MCQPSEQSFIYNCHITFSPLLLSTISHCKASKWQYSAILLFPFKLTFVSLPHYALFSVVDCDTRSAISDHILTSRSAAFEPMAHLASSSTGGRSKSRRAPTAIHSTHWPKHQNGSHPQDCLTLPLSLTTPLVYLTPNWFRNDSIKWFQLPDRKSVV